MSQKAVEIKQSAPLDARIAEPPPSPGPEHQRLNVFIGKWNTTGRQYEGPIGPSAKITAVETFEWLRGGFFLTHRFDGRVGDGEAACIEIIGYDAQNQNYPVHTFYNNGVTNEWQYREHDGVWTLTGSWKLDGKSMKTRCTVVFSDARDAMTGKWEFLSDDSKWETFWEVKATKVK